ncbi:MAG: carboxylesterase/lipase family protein [Casimicrobiaceae bacterium]
MRRNWALACTLATGAWLAAGTESSTTASAAYESSGVPTVSLPAGTVQGAQEGGLAVFKGIPFAAPPTGDLRWREPQPAVAWQGTRIATAFGNACIQIPGAAREAGGEPGPLNEDCLYLNIWTPRPDPSLRLPVMVWIHGGALAIGAASVALYDGAPLSKRGAVVVTFNYRLGQLGFFAHPALDKENQGRAVNFGLLDQVAVLKWVRQNIAAFGGDPGNVTIFGESAGGQSVLALFASPLARGLFSKGIAESAYGLPSHTRDKARTSGIAVATALGLSGADASLADLRAIPAEKFGSFKGPGLSLSPSFVVGDAALPKPILTVFKEGGEAPVPLIIGSNSDEATVAVAFGIDPARLVERMGLARIPLRSLYPGVSSDAELGRESVRDLIFTTFARRIAYNHSRKAPTWRYYFSYIPVELRGKAPGVPHGGEIAFVLGTGDVSPLTKETFADEDRAMSNRVGDYWITFARSGQPAPAGHAAWPRDGIDNAQTMIFGDSVGAEKDFMKARLNAFIELLLIL